MRLSSLTARIAGEAAETWDVHERAVRKLARGEDVILLTIGDPDFDTPGPIREAARASIARGRTHYAEIPGTPQLRSAIAASASPVLGRTVPGSEVVVFPGAQAALFALAQVLFEDGDEVITPEPTYVTYEGVIGAAGATMRQIPLRPGRQFHLDPDDLARAVTPRTRGLVLNFPHNPTGATLTREEAEAVAALCRRHDLVLVSDEVYASLTFNGPHQSPAALPGMAARTAVVSSLSKSHAMTGFRCGWSIAPEPITRALYDISRCMFFGVAQFVQDAAVEALTRAGADLTTIRDAYANRAGVVVEHLGRMPGLGCHMPEAGMYVFLDIRGTGMSGTEFALALLDATGVAVTPGEGFGPSGAGHVRMTMGAGEARLREACERIRRFVEGRPR